MAGFRLLLAACAAALWTLGPAASAAPAAPPCWRIVLAQWSAGTLESTYSPTCYRTALERLPEDVAMYSSAQDDIRQALLGAISRQPAARALRRSSTGAVDLIAPVAVAAGGVLLIATAVLAARRLRRHCRLETTNTG